MTPPLAVLFAQHKAAVLGAGAAGVAGLALLQRKKTAAAGGSTTSRPAGTIPAAAVVQGTYPDTSATDMYNQLEGQLERLQAGNSQAVPVPTPVASTLFAPTGTGNLVRFSDGGLGEIESDGSVFGMTLSQNAAAADAARAAGTLSWNQLNSPMPSSWSTETNLSRVAATQKTS